METVILLLFITGLIFTLYVCIRNEYVFKFFNELNDACHQAALRAIEQEKEVASLTNDEKQNLFNYSLVMWNDIMSLPYELVLFSFKPLRPECWLTRDQLAFLSSSFDINQ